MYFLNIYVSLIPIAFGLLFVIVSFIFGLLILKKEDDQNV